MRHVSILSNCARCGGAHKKLECKEFKHPPHDSDGMVWSHWATCPTTGDPVFIAALKLVGSFVKTEDGLAKSDLPYEQMRLV